MYVKPFLVCIPRLGSPILSFPLMVIPWVPGAFPNAARCLLCSNSPNSSIFLYCSGDTPVTIEFPTGRRFYGDLGHKKYIYVVVYKSKAKLNYSKKIGFSQNARCITVGRSSPASARVSAPPDLKKCMVNAVRSPVLRACTFSAFVIYVADMGVFPLMGVPVFGRQKILGKKVPLRHVPAQRSPYCDVLLNCSDGTYML